MKIPIITPIWNYIKDSWEGPDGRFSYRRASQFLWSFNMVYIMISTRLKGGMDKYEFYMFVTNAILWVLTASLLSFEQLFYVLKLTLPRGLRRKGADDMTTNAEPSEETTNPSTSSTGISSDEREIKMTEQ